MADRKGETDLVLGVFGRRTDGGRFSVTELVAAVLSAAWLLISGVLFLIFPLPETVAGPAMTLVSLLAVFMPIALIWVAVSAVRTGRLYREDRAEMQAAIESLRKAKVLQSQGSVLATTPQITTPAPTAPRAEEGAERDPSHRPALSTRPTVTPQAAPSDPQPSLALEAPPKPSEALRIEDFIRALNFPNDEGDTEGFRALKRALEDHEAARLIRASQDILTLLSQDGIYMDDLQPDRSHPELWRRFAAGERGRVVASLGGVRERSAIALTTARMKQDVIFRDAAHHFLRHFDKAFAGFAPMANDQEIADLTETRTARAFMLLGRATGTFD